MVDRPLYSDYHVHMESLVAARTMEQIDLDTQNIHGIPALVLMEQAGIRGWATLCTSVEGGLPIGTRLVFVAGGGNNGGDALVMARQAVHDGFSRVTVLLIGSRTSTSCAIQRRIVRSLGLDIHENEENAEGPDQVTIKTIAEADILIDGLAGTGLRGSLSGLAANIAALMNERKDQGGSIWSIDIPSGCCDTLGIAHPHVRADVTVTMGLYKYAAFHPASRSAWGKILKVNPCFVPQVLSQAPAAALLCTDSDAVIPVIGEESYKNRRGHLGLFAGSKAYSGAPRLASRSAFHARCGLVTLCCTADIAAIVSQESPSVIVHALAHAEILPAEQLARDFQAIAAGPGWGPTHLEQLLEILASGLPVLLDADAIALFAQAVAEKRIGHKEHGPLVLSPHPGELHRMLERLSMPLLAQETGNSGTPESFIDSMQKVARSFEAVLAYRSHVVWIFDGRQDHSVPVVVDGMNSSLGVAGSGDVFAGILAAFLAQGMDVAQATQGAALVHQKAGILARAEHGWFDSEELSRHVGHACRALERVGS
jgi:NAD(P)H-hydrate epimerase